MYADQLINLINSDNTLKRIFCGIFAYDTLDNFSLKKNKICALIINTDPSTLPGEHWLLVYFNPHIKTIIWFDSYGHSPNYYGKEIKKWLWSFGLIVKISSQKIQSEKSEYCGLFCLYVLYFLSRNVPLYKILSNFSVNLNYNDKIVQYFVWDIFKLKIINMIKKL